VTGNAAVGQKIGRVGEDGVESAFRIFSRDGVEELETVAVIQIEQGRFV
jgi:hypothetical protein